MLDDQMDIDVYPEQDIRLLKAIVTDKGAAIDCIYQLRPDMFSEQTRGLATAAFDYVKEYKSLPTQRILKDQVDPDVVDAIFERINHSQFNKEELAFDIKKLKQTYIDVQTDELKNDVQLNRMDLSALEKRVKSIREISSSKVKVFHQQDLSSYADAFKKEYLEKATNPIFDRGILTRYQYLDYICNGVQNPEFWLICGVTGGGKSVMLNNMAVQMWMQGNTITTESNKLEKGYNVLFFSLEMPFKSCYRRTMSKIADVPIYGLRDASLSKSELERVGIASDFSKRYKPKFRIVDVPRGVTVPLIEEIYTEVCESFKPDVVFVDYLGLLQDNEVEGDDWLKLGHIANRLAEFGRVYNIPVITAVQLNRMGQSKKDEADSIGVHRIGRSGMIAHHANVVIQIESKENDHLRNDITMHLIKNRDGEKGSHTFLKDFKNASIKDTPYAPNEEKVMNLMQGFDQRDISKQLQAALGIDLIKKK